MVFRLLSLLILSFALPAQDEEHSEQIKAALKKKVLRVLGEPIRAHSGAAHSVVWSPDGSIVCSAGNGESIKVWNGKTGSLLRSLAIGDDCATGIALVDNGKRLVSVGAGAVYAWNPKTGKLLKKIKFSAAHNNESRARARLAVHEGAGLLACSKPVDGKIALFGLAKLKQKFELRCDVGVIRDLAFSPDGSRLFAIGLKPNRLLAFDLEKKKLVKQIEVSGRNCLSLALTPDGTQLWLSSDTELHSYSLPALTPIDAFRAINEAINSMAFSKGGRRVFLGCGASSVACYDLDKKELLFRKMEGTGEITAVAISPDQKTLCVTQQGFVSSSVHFYDSKTGEVAFPLSGHQARVAHATFSPDGKQLVTGGDGGHVIVWDAKSGKKLRIIARRKKGIAGLQFVGKNQIWCADQAGVFDRISFVKGEADLAVRATKQHYTHYRFVVTSDQTVAWSTHNDSTVYVWDLATNKLTDEIKLEGSEEMQPLLMELSPKGTRIAICDGAGYLHIFDAKTRKLLLRWKPYESDDTPEPTFLSEDSIATLGGQKSEFRIYSLEAGKLKKTIHVGAKMALACALSPDGKRFAVATFEELVVFNTKSFKKLKSTRAFDGVAKCLCFDPKGKKIAMGLQNNQVLLIDWKKMP